MASISRTSLCIVVSVFAFTFLVVAVKAQQPNTATALRPEIEKLSFLVGEWKGKGKTRTGAKISQTVKVTKSADGASLRVKESRRYGDFGTFDPGSAIKPMELPEGIITYDPQSKLYRYAPTSRFKDHPFQLVLVDPNTVDVTRHLTDSMIRFRINIDDKGKWHETIEFLLPEGWQKTQETVLERHK